jgi:hypothetical protein
VPESDNLTHNNFEEMDWTGTMGAVIRMASCKQSDDRLVKFYSAYASRGSLSIAAAFFSISLRHGAWKRLPYKTFFTVPVATRSQRRMTLIART